MYEKFESMINIKMKHLGFFKLERFHILDDTIYFTFNYFVNKMLVSIDLFYFVDKKEFSISVSYCKSRSSKTLWKLYEIDFNYNEIVYSTSREKNNHYINKTVKTIIN